MQLQLVCNTAGEGEAPLLSVIAKVVIGDGFGAFVGLFVVFLLILFECETSYKPSHGLA